MIRTPYADAAVDAAGAVDAQTAPTAPWETARGFPQATTANPRPVLHQKGHHR